MGNVIIGLLFTLERMSFVQQKSVIKVGFSIFLSYLSLGVFEGKATSLFKAKISFFYYI